MADSGSPYSIINRDTRVESFEQKLGEKLEIPDIHPVSYTGEPIDLLGFRKLSFEFKGRRADCKLYVSAFGPCVLGWWDQGELGILLDPNSPDPVLSVGEMKVENCGMIVPKFSKVFSGAWMN